MNKHNFNNLLSDKELNVITMNKYFYVYLIKLLYFLHYVKPIAVYFFLHFKENEKKIFYEFETIHIVFIIPMCLLVSKIYSATFFCIELY